MAGYGVREARINRERRVRVNLCGDCGCEIAETELLCPSCMHLEDDATGQGRQLVREVRHDGSTIRDVTTLVDKAMTR